MLRSKDTWGECNGEWDENYFGSFSKRNFKNPRSRQVLHPGTRLPVPIVNAQRNGAEISLDRLKERQNKAHLPTDIS